MVKGMNTENIMPFIRETFLWFLEKKEPKKREVLHYTPDEIKDMPKQFREEYAKMAGELAAHKKTILGIKRERAEQFQIKKEILEDAERLKQRDESTRISLDMLKKHKPAVFSTDGFYLGHYHSIDVQGGPTPYFAFNTSYNHRVFTVHRAASLERLFKNPESLADTLGRGGFIVLNRNHNGNVPPSVEYGVFNYMPKAGEKSPEGVEEESLEGIDAEDVLNTALKDAQTDISKMSEHKVDLEKKKEAEVEKQDG